MAEMFAGVKFRYSGGKLSYQMVVRSTTTAGLSSRDQGGSFSLACLWSENTNCFPLTHKAVRRMVGLHRFEARVCRSKHTHARVVS